MKEFIINNKNLMAEWDVVKNKEFGYDPAIITCGSHIEVWWKCLSCGNQYSLSPRNKKRAIYGCKICAMKARSKSNRKTKTLGKKTFAELYPELINEWIECEDKNLTPYNTVSGTKKMVKWKCPVCHREYNTLISNRTLRHSGCPYCAGQKVLKGYNDLNTLYPEIAKTWSSLNKLNPDDVTSHSNKVVYWKCDFGHDDFLKSVKLRVNGQGCPKCANALQTSFPEQAIYYYLKKVYSKAINRYKLDNKFEIDIFIPELNVGIEYNGYYYHKNKTIHDDRKRIECLKRGINIITINEIHKGKKATNQADLYIIDNYSPEEFKLLFKSLLHKLNQTLLIDVDINRDSIKIKEQYMFFVRENSILEKCPEIASEWDCNKNCNIKPDFVPYGSSQKFHWICSKCNQEFISTPKQRTSGRGCPYCARKKVKTGLNDLATIYPRLLKEWDYKKNTKLPTEVYAGGRTVYYWICNLGHSYACSIENKRFGCPICAGKQILKGFNDLESQKPELSKDWDTQKNKLSPDKVHCNSFRRFYWKCHICGYEWNCNIVNRSRCPNCSKKHKIINVYDFKTGAYLFEAVGISGLCSKLNIDYKKQHGNISTLCAGKQISLLGKYVIRYKEKDEFKNLTDNERLKIWDPSKYKTNKAKKINVYNKNKQYLFSASSIPHLCSLLNVELKKQRGNISSVCNGKQKTFLNKYLLRYDDNDEMKNL